LWAGTSLLAMMPNACEPDLVFAINQTFTPAEFEEIRAAANDWNVITNAEHKIRFGEGGWLILKRQPPGGWNGLAKRQEAEIWISPATTEPVRRVARHEFGHALGLRHLCTTDSVQGAVASYVQCDVKASRGVMDAWTASDEFSDEDKQECRRVGACD
jgi:hypothetical protein